MMVQVNRKKAMDYQPDSRNVNKGTERGHRVLDDSLNEVGLGRSVLVDKNGTLIAGNKTHQAAIDNGFDEVIEVETDGNALVVVKRIDLDLNDPDPNNSARKAAYYDNRAGELDLKWDSGIIIEDMQLGVEIDELFKDDFSWIEADSIETTATFDKPAITSKAVDHRVFVNGLKKQALSVLVPELPAPDVELYIISNGSGAEKKWQPGGIDQMAIDFGTFIFHLIDLFAMPCECYLSTWTMNRQHALSILEALDNGNLSRLMLFTDPYFIRRESTVHAQLMTGFEKHKERVRYLAFKNHCKIIALSTSNNRTCVVTGSANLSAQPRCEQYNLTTSPDVFNFYRDAFFETMWNNRV